MIHKLTHLLGWNEGRVYTWRDPDSGAFMVGFRCDGCGDIQLVHRVLLHNHDK